MHRGASTRSGVMRVGSCGRGTPIGFPALWGAQVRFPRKSCINSAMVAGVRDILSYDILVILIRICFGHLILVP